MTFAKTALTRDTRGRAAGAGSSVWRRRPRRRIAAGSAAPHQDSVAHWEQYQAIMHTAFSPKRIEIGAECARRDQYKTLRNWCQWIADEVSHAPELMAHADRHGSWQPPAATSRGFIDEWRFELDRDAVFERLINDVYDDKLAFVRELLQNAFDASRVQLYLDLETQKLPTPEYPNDAPETLRAQYPIEVTLKKAPAYDGRRQKRQAESLSYTAVGVGQALSLSPPSERQFLTIIDHGVGMDRNVIARYLLQIGRSYYKSEEFLKRFHFVPTQPFRCGISVGILRERSHYDRYAQSDLRCE